MNKNVTVSAAGWMVIAAVICAAGVWLFAQRVLIPYQKVDATAHERPRGNLSDLYPRWLGARELLLHGRDPYSEDVTREIQEGYYGRALDAGRAEDPKDQQGFAYPVYVVFCMAPTVGLPFAVVQKGFFWVLLVVTAASALVWLRVLGWEASCATQFTVVVLTVGSLAVMQGLKLEQMSLLVAALVAIAMLLLVREHAVAAGILLAFATIKPQLVVLLLVWLAIWTLGDWRRRYQWCVAFVVTMGILAGASEWYLPHWIPRFVHALGEYQRYTGAVGVMEKLLGTVWGRTLELVAFAAMLYECWARRRIAASSAEFALMAGLVLAVTVLVAPTYAPYNQVLLIPAVLVLAEERGSIWRRGVAGRVLLAVTAVLVAWPWIASVVLVGLSFILPRQVVERGWAIPFWTALLIPVGVAAMMLAWAAQRSFAASGKAATS